MQKIVRHFLLRMTEHDAENLAIIQASDPLIPTETAAIRYALEMLANNSGTPQHVNTLRKTIRMMQKAEAK